MAYIEGVLQLYRIVKSEMSEEEKVGQLLKGIAEDVYNFLIGKDQLNTTADVIQHCRSFETLKMRRITTKFGRLEDVTTVATIDVAASVDLAETVRRIVREELSRHEELTRSPGDVREGCAVQEVHVSAFQATRNRFNATTLSNHREPAPGTDQEWGHSRV